MQQYKHMIIRFGLGGAVVKVGCQRLMFTDREAIKKAFCSYIDNPEETEKQWLNNDWARHGEDQTTVPD